MNFDLDKSLQGVAPWDFTLTYNTAIYPTARPSIGLIGRLQQVKSVEKPDLETLGAMFCEPRPELPEWPAEAVMGAMAAYVAYFNAQAIKNSQAIAHEAQSAMAGK